jgi:hypothetical protein
MVSSTLLPTDDLETKLFTWCIIDLNGPYFSCAINDEKSSQSSSIEIIQLIFY